MAARPSGWSGGGRTVGLPLSGGFAGPGESITGCLTDAGAAFSAHLGAIRSPSVSSAPSGLTVMPAWYQSSKSPLNWACTLINGPRQLAGTAGFEPATP